MSTTPNTNVVVATSPFYKGRGMRNKLRDALEGHPEVVHMEISPHSRDVTANLCVAIGIAEGILKEKKVVAIEIGTLTEQEATWLIASGKIKSMTFLQTILRTDTNGQHVITGKDEKGEPIFEVESHRKFIGISLEFEEL